MHAQIADTPELRAAASALIARQYVAAGYGQHDLPAGEQCVSLVVIDQDIVVGTLTIAFDGPAGLLVDQAYGRYVDDRRAVLRHCAEITKLAFHRAAGGY